MDSGQAIAPVATLIYFHPLKGPPFNIPYTYGSDWTSLTTACRLYKDTDGELSAITEAKPGSSAYFPLSSSQRHLRVGFVPWVAKPRAP